MGRMTTCSTDSPDPGTYSQAHAPHLGLGLGLKLNVEHAREVLAQAVAGGTLQMA